MEDRGLILAIWKTVRASRIWLRASGGRSPTDDLESWLICYQRALAYSAAELAQRSANPVE